MLLTILKIVAGVAVLGIIALVLIAVVSGLKSSVHSLRGRKDDDDNSDVG
jgi:hypothetical protein